ncbi:protein ROOT PRIMORDIUM DEFECTIVE 1 [Gastrolobium bilobum]|uniref:protein ROOT PRIMORDIUM DEFECTIVE 1 n=1 Tax=Gastrolobium bilobum TaxID=150636 RepID=UPI002AAF96B9|nr:protein ROOT PRIMORDIUM DEFECTIVE 1 [Gastrolobium bilobum]XP_061344525.1 protein ROOT PRIMORDIUM DEFECTIVE 1 [Gastrolobium bilobum]XP_061344526.1 protein ROOT PRIMORDIUM DEFECTIVE 1 [Gastrolobium bilobum]XP_061344527.1 protein ROOT PRIMORDIUM DEFECTIVE 1 [Gastrolobium bilobum]
MSLFSSFRYRIFQSTILPKNPFVFFNQKRWRKPIVSAQTRLEDRVRDTHLDKFMTHLKKLKLVLRIHHLMLNRKRGAFVSLQLMSRWRNIVGLNVTVGSFLHEYPHVFEVFVQPLRRNLCCRITRRMKEMILLEEVAVRQQELEAVKRVKKLLMMAVNGTLHIHALRLMRRELGLPEDFRDSILGKYSGDFRLVDLEIVALVDRDDDNELGMAQVEKWREREYTEKWLSEFETKFAFPINFPTGFKIERGFRDKLKSWQRLPYTKPYERKEVIRVRTCGGIERYEKRAVAVLHELLSLTVEKMVEVDQLAHFRRDFAIEVNVRELLLSHPGIFYISTKGESQTVFLREAYRKGGLIEPNPVYTARRNMLDLVLLGRRRTKQLLACNEFKEVSNAVVHEVHEEGKRQGDWVIPFLESCEENRSS